MNVDCKCLKNPVISFFNFVNKNKFVKKKLFKIYLHIMLYNCINYFRQNLYFRFGPINQHFKYICNYEDARA